VALAALLAGGPRAVLAQADADGVRAAVERANSPAVWGEALRRADPAPLATIWAGDALDYFSGEVLMFRARGLRLLSTPVDLQVLGVELLPGDRAQAETTEEWHDYLCSAEGELRGERRARVRDRYELEWRDAAWWVSGVDVDLVGGSFSWTPAEDPAESASPCAAVLDWEAPPARHEGASGRAGAAAHVAARSATAGRLAARIARTIAAAAKHRIAPDRNAGV